MNGIEANLLIDTGCSRSVISKNFVSKNKLESVPSKRLLVLANWDKINAEGQILNLEVKFENHTTIINPVIVHDSGDDLIIGMDILIELDAHIETRSGNITFGIRETDEAFLLEEQDSFEDNSHRLKAHRQPIMEDMEISWEFEEKSKMRVDTRLTVKQEQSFNKVIDKHTPIFATCLKDLKKCRVKKEFTIELKDPTKSSVNKRPYPMNPLKRTETKRQVDELLAEGIIEKSMSSWSSPALLIPKPNNKWRLCIDYRDTNSNTIKQSFQMPLIQYILDRLAGSNYFSVIDLQSGYWQVRISKESRHITAFSTPDGHFEWSRVPFGLTNAPMVFSRIMKDITEGCEKFVEVYLDDTIIFSKTIEDHINHINIVLKKLSEGGMMVNSAKCFFILQSIKYLGFIISKNQVRMDPEKIEAIVLREHPNDVAWLAFTGD